MIEFSFEAPLKNLNDFTEDQDFIFALSFLCSNKKYSKYLEDCRANGYNIIIDNSYNELHRATSLKTLITLFYRYDAYAIICPDSDSWGIKKYEEIFCEVSELLQPKEYYIVARNPIHFERLEDIGVEQMAIPYEFRPAWTGNVSYDGYKMSDKANLRQSHFLGLNTLMEPKTFQAKSCDTSMPIKLAILGKTMEQWVKEGCPHINTVPKFFDLTLTTKQIALAKKNINDIKYFNKLPEVKAHEKRD